MGRRFLFQNSHRSCFSCGTWDPLPRCVDVQQIFDPLVCSYCTCTAWAREWSEASDGATAGLMQQKQLCGVIVLNISLLFFIQRQQGRGNAHAGNISWKGSSGSSPSACPTSLLPSASSSVLIPLKILIYQTVPISLTYSGSISGINLSFVVSNLTPEHGVKLFLISLLKCQATIWLINRGKVQVEKVSLKPGTCFPSNE